MRGIFGLAATALAGVAGVVANQDGDTSIVPFFIGLAVVSAGVVWLTQEPYTGLRRTFAQAVAAAWIVGGIWIAALLLYFREGDGPPPAPEATYLGLTAVIYHLAGMYGGLVCVLVASAVPDRWFRRPEHAMAKQEETRPTRTD